MENRVYSEKDKKKVISCRYKEAERKPGARSGEIKKPIAWIATGFGNYKGKAESSSPTSFITLKILRA